MGWRGEGSGVTHCPPGGVGGGSPIHHRPAVVRDMAETLEGLKAGAQRGKPGEREPRQRALAGCRWQGAEPSELAGQEESRPRSIEGREQEPEAAGVTGVTERSDQVRRASRGSG